MSKRDDYKRNRQHGLPFPPYASRSDTSKAAAVSVAPTTGTLRAMVLDYIHALCWSGATCDEAERDLEMAHQTASPRFWELRKSGQIVDSGKRRKTRSGRSATVWVGRGFAQQARELEGTES